MTVDIGEQSCGSVAVTDEVGLTEATCTAPGGPGQGSLNVTVTVSGKTGSHPDFLYDPPSIAYVQPSPCDALVTCTVLVCGDLAADRGD
jgi:hypothetical protein